MSEPFSSFNAKTSSETLKLISDAICHGNTITPERDRTPKAHDVTVSEDFNGRLLKIKNWWNLDRSEASRRTYIDAYIYEAMLKGKSASIIVTPEETITNDTARLGHGALDFLLSAIENAPLHPPIYIPSIIIEAKVNIVPDPPIKQGENQILAEMATVWQLRPAGWKGDFLRGVLTDGRFWWFYEMQVAHSLLITSKRYDATNTEQQMHILSFLSRLFQIYNTSDSIFLG